MQVVGVGGLYCLILVGRPPSPPNDCRPLSLPPSLLEDVYRALTGIHTHSSSLSPSLFLSLLSSLPLFFSPSVWTPQEKEEEALFLHSSVSREESERETEREREKPLARRYLQLNKYVEGKP